MAATPVIELPTFALAHPLVLLPSARITLPVTSKLADAIIRLVDSTSDSGQHVVLAAVPLLPPQHPQPQTPQSVHNKPGKAQSPKLNEWGVSARVIKLVRPPSIQRTASQTYLLVLQGISRIRLLDAETASKLTSKKDSLPTLAYESPDSTSSQNRSGALIRIGDDGVADVHSGELPSMEEFVSFKNAALRMLERLSQDTAQIRKREGWVKVMGLVEDLEEDRAGWMADMLVSTVPSVDYADKIGELF